MSLARTPNIQKQSAKIRTHDAADAFELMKSRDKGLMLCSLVDILKESALGEAEEMSVSLRRGS